MLPYQITELTSRFARAELVKFSSSSRAPASAAATANSTGSTVTPLVKHVLSRELQLYFARLTEALASDEQRDAALGSVRTDPGLHQLVPYLVGWGGEQIANHLSDLPTLLRSLDLFHAMLENDTLFIEPYLHQITPPILTCLLTSSLPPAPPPSPSPLTIRTSAGSLLALLLARHAAAYPSLSPRVTKTLLRGLVGTDRGLGARWGAARGLAAVIGSATTNGGEGPTSGNRAVKEWVGSSLRGLGEMVEREQEDELGERALLVGEVLVSLTSLHATPRASVAVGTHADDLSLVTSLSRCVTTGRAAHGGRCGVRWPSCARPRAGRARSALRAPVWTGHPRAVGRGRGRHLGGRPGRG